MTTRASHGGISGVASIVGVSPWARRIRSEILAVADYDSNVLITGPSGTGKELVARALCFHGGRAAGPLVPVDCAAAPGELFASQMFGHLRGAFTGAHYDALGAFRAASGGTIFLDEIGELTPAAQAKLLRVIQEREVVPLGSHRGEPVNVRIIAATNRDLETEVREERFREDLYYRLNVISLQTAPLADRLEDIEPLANHFLSRLAVEAGLRLLRLSPEAIAMLLQCPWPGNVRQLYNQLERAAIRTQGDWIEPEAMPELADLARARDARAAERGLPSPCGQSPRQRNDEPTAIAQRATDASWPTMAELERGHILQTLLRTAYNQSTAARLLSIDRHALRRKMRKYGLGTLGRGRGRPASDANAPRFPR